MMKMAFFGFQNFLKILYKNIRKCPYNVSVEQRKSVGLQNNPPQII